MQNLSTEELEQQLITYKEKFAQIEAVIKQDPNNEAIVKARQDLLDIINLAEDLLKLRKKPIAVTLKEVSSREKEREKEKEREIEKRPREETEDKSLEDGEQVEVEEEIEAEDGTKQIVKFTIPKSLKILPSDSEEIRHHKRKRIKVCPFKTLNSFFDKTSKKFNIP